MSRHPPLTSAPPRQPSATTNVLSAVMSRITAAGTGGTRRGSVANPAFSRHTPDTTVARLPPATHPPCSTVGSPCARHQAPLRPPGGPCHLPGDHRPIPQPHPCRRTGICCSALSPARSAPGRARPQSEITGNR
ncbi:translation initiation factor IF-2-like isoform X1 [Felis catus]|uniref:translation initiation factor IF-2-like isoform X1 n=1 Tax=Felis catus TaxID=9685 RepID=UPI001D19EF47|nr:translation initiation factor IF-2-like isoform X1 [Felis catus]